VESRSTPARVTVVVGFAEALSAPEVVWSLVDAGFDVIAFARRGRASAVRHSRHVVCHEICAPESDLQTAISELHSLMVSLSVSSDDSQWLLFPLDDKAVYLCSKIQVDDRWVLIGPQDGCADFALNKYLQTEAARNAGFKVPRTQLVRTADDILKWSDADAFPMILRPVECVPIDRGRLAAGRHWVCADPDELKRAVAKWAERIPLLAQPFIAGTGEGIFGLAAPDGVRAWSAHRRLRMMNPQGSGSSACVSQTVPEDLKAAVESLIKTTRWRGLFMVELLRDHAGNSWFVEFNGRPWGSIALSRRQGFEYPAWHAGLAMNEQSSVGVTMSGAPGVVCRNVGRELMHILFVLRGARSKALTEWPSFWKALSDVVHVRGTDTLYNWRRSDRKVFIADCYYTLHGNLFKTRN
jgi:predicted ATP-grasp superfamily ATP-dependent carboligase